KRKKERVGKHGQCAKYHHCCDRNSNLLRFAFNHRFSSHDGCSTAYGASCTYQHCCVLIQPENPCSQNYGQQEGTTNDKRSDDNSGPTHLRNILERDAEAEENNACAQQDVL